MCGLILAPSYYSEKKLRVAMVKMGYRGADGLCGLAEGFGWKLGHVRLAIQDLSEEGHQPFFSRRSMTAFVGEFFTHEGRGEQHYLRLLLDSEDFHLADGFWSVVDVTEMGAKVYTDHLGIKPLYWWPEKNIVCSEIAPMFALENPPGLNELYLSNCIKFGYDYSSATAYKGIFQIQSGSKLFLPGSGLPSCESYWDWSKVPGEPTNLRALVDRAIDNRLIGDRPVALLLSGGLDSSIIYYSLAFKGRQVQTFSVENGETEYLPDGTEVMDLDPMNLSHAVQIMQAPLDLGSLVPQIQLAQAVKTQGFNVVMTGDGADELFGGYRRAKVYDSQHSDVFCELPFYHLPRLDRVMMRATIELRTPFLAPSVVAAALRLPWSSRTEKQALKHAYEGVVPSRILDRVKHPLKTQAVISGGQSYRHQLVEEFRNVSSYL